MLTSIVTKKQISNCTVTELEEGMNTKKHEQTSEGDELFIIFIVLRFQEYIHVKTHQIDALHMCYLLSVNCTSKKL